MLKFDLTPATELKRLEETFRLYSNRVDTADLIQMAAGLTAARVIDKCRKLHNNVKITYKTKK